MPTILMPLLTFGHALLQVQSFIDKKSSQFVFYIRGFWRDHIPYKELEMFLWDTLEEWSELKHTQSQLYTHKERIFWHLFHETQFVSATTLKTDKILKEEVAFCLEYLENEKAFPLDVVGMRP